MKGIVVTPDMEVSVQDFAEPLYKTVGAVVSGYIEHVLPVNLEPPYCLICNEEGLLKGLPVNPIGSWLYGTQEHGHPVVGIVVIMKDEDMGGGEMDIAGLTDDEVEELAVMLSKLKHKLAWGRA